MSWWSSSEPPWWLWSEPSWWLWSELSWWSSSEPSLWSELPYLSEPPLSRTPFEPEPRLWVWLLALRRPQARSPTKLTKCTASSFPLIGTIGRLVERFHNRTSGTRLPLPPTRLVLHRFDGRGFGRRRRYFLLRRLPLRLFASSSGRMPPMALKTERPPSFSSLGSFAE